MLRGSFFRRNLGLPVTLAVMLLPVSPLITADWLTSHPSGPLRSDPSPGVRYALMASAAPVPGSPLALLHAAAPASPPVEAEVWTPSAALPAVKPSAMPEWEYPSYTGWSDQELPQEDVSGQRINGAATDQHSPIQLTTTTISRAEIAILNAEWSWLNGITRRATSAQAWSEPFLLPVAGRITSPFGEIRMDEGLPHTPHLGVDLGARAGAPVAAANTGVVIFAGGLEVRGNAVVIDHGSGVFSGYYHLSSIEVTPGQTVQRGTAVGAVGGTGLSTGPHLHWDMIVQGKHTNPLVWVGRQAIPDAKSQPVYVLASSGPQIAGAPNYPTLRLSADQTDGVDGASAAADAPSIAAKAAEAEAAAKAKEATAKAEAAAKRAARAVAIRQHYLDLLGRDPLAGDQASLESWTDSSLSLDQVRHDLVREGRAERLQQVRRFYVDLLGRDPAGTDDASLTSWADSAFTLKELRSAIARDGAGERTARIQALYLKLLGRDPAVGDRASLQAWVISDLTIAQVEQRIMATEEYTLRAKR